MSGQMSVSDCPTCIITSHKFDPNIITSHYHESTESAAISADQEMHDHQGSGRCHVAGPWRRKYTSLYAGRDEGKHFKSLSLTLFLTLSI